MGRLDGQVAVITGGASGIGEATVKLFVEEGARVLVADVQDGKGEALADALGGSAVYQHTDVSQEVEVRRAVGRAIEEYGRLDCMFNNAGLPGAIGPIEETPVDEYDLTMNVLLRGVFLGIKHSAPIMKKQGKGAIINTASVAGLGVGFGPHFYSAAKAAVIHLTRSVAMELGESGVRVNCICPGAIATPIFKKFAGGGDDAAVVEAVKPLLAQGVPLKRSGLSEDIANAALWLASDDASFVNGHALVVDGGHSVGKLWSEQAEPLRRYQPMTPP